MCMHSNTYIYVEILHMDSSKDCHSVALKNMWFFHFYSSNEQKCNTVLWGNMTPSKKYLFLLCHWKMMKGKKQG